MPKILNEWVRFKTKINSCLSTISLNPDLGLKTPPV